MPDEDLPTLKRFFQAFTLNWLTKCSGSLSVPFASAAALIPNAPVRLLFIVLAVLGFLTACYAVWKNERLKLAPTALTIQKLEEALTNERTQRPKPELYLGNVIEVNPYDKATFSLSNKGVSALNIRFAPVIGLKTALQFNSLDYLHHDETRYPGFVIFQNGAYVPAGNNQYMQLIELLCQEYGQFEVTLPLTIECNDGDSRRFRTAYDLTFNVAARHCKLTFKGRTIVDNHYPFSINPSNLPI